MSYLERLKKIDLLQQRIQAHGKLDAAVQKKINYKFRLDWNYYSNRMEGGTLTREETRSVMVGNIDVKGKPLKDVMEMNGHNQVVLDILRIGAGELRMSEKRIKDFHKAIMHEEDPAKVSEVGNWKSHPNEIINYKDEKISFTPPSEVAEAMHRLLDKTNAELDAYFTKKKSAHPVVIAAQFHIDYVSIHPFYDGNGRTARILTNLLLISCGLPPVIIKDERKTAYYQLLADIQAYGGNPELFFAFIGDRVIESQELILNAIEGKEIDDPDDMDKKIALLEKELEAIDPNEEIKLHFNRLALFDILRLWGFPLLERAVPAVQKFNRLFTGTRHWIAVRNGLGSIEFVDQPVSEVIDKLRDEFARNADRASYHDMSLALTAFYGSFKKGGLNTFGCTYGFEVKFDHIKYEVWVDNFSEDGQKKREMLYQRLLHKLLTEAEISNVVKHLEEAIFQHIDFYTKKNGLR